MHFSALYALKLFDLYSRGDPERGIKPDPKQAKHYIEIAANTGNLIAIFNLAVMEQNSNITKSVELFEKCAEGGMEDCNLGIGHAYAMGKGVEQNVTKGIEHLEKVNGSKFNEAAAFLAMIYSQFPEFKNETKALYYLEIALEGDNNVQASFQKFVLLYDKITKEHNFDTCKESMDLIKDMTDGTFFIKWLEMAQIKYKIGEVNQALMMYSFAALMGSKAGAESAAYIWRNNLTHGMS